MGTRNKKTETFESHIMPHCAIEQVIPDRLWRVTGTLNFPFPREMDIYKLPGTQSLLLYSVIALNEDQMQALEALGTPAILYAPNQFHMIDLGVYANRYPQAKVICPEGCKAIIEEGVKVDTTIEEEIAKNGQDYPFTTMEVKCMRYPFTILFADAGAGNGAVIVFLNDLLWNITKIENKGIISSVLAWALGMEGPLHMTRYGRWFVLQDKKEFAEVLRKVAEKKIKALMVCHGDPITEDCEERLRQVADTF